MVAAILDGSITATTTIDVIQEFAHGYARRRPRAVAVQHALRYATLLTPLLAATDRDLLTGLRLHKNHERLDAFDAVLAATAIAHDAEALVSADPAFTSIRGLAHVVPGTGEFERLLAA